MNDRYERVGEARDPEFQDEPVHAPEFGNVAGQAGATPPGGEHYIDHASIEPYQEEQYHEGSSNGTELENGYIVPQEPSRFGTMPRPGHGPQAFEEQVSPLLLEMEEIEDFKLRWPEIKATFVDDPRDSVQLADQMLIQVTELIARRVGEERARLESEWNGRNDVTTEDLRQSLHRYQVFFDRLTNT